MTSFLGTLIVTAYCATGHPCADGHAPRPGLTVAAPRNVPLGSWLFVEGIGWRRAEDRTARKYDGRVDVFMGTRATCRRWGKRNLKVWIYESKTKRYESYHIVMVEEP